MMKRIGLYLVACMALFCSCTQSLFVAAAPEIVVEGWIDNGGFPIVIVTTTMPIDDEFHGWNSVRDHVIRWAKVSVHDGENEYVLTGRINDDYFPSYIYTTSRLRGEAGRTYSLKVEYGGREVTAQTRIPFPVPLEWIKVDHSENGMASITAGLKDNPMAEDYYKIFVRTEKKDSIYKSALMGLFSDDVLSDGENVIIVRGAQDEQKGASTTSMYHGLDDVVYIKFCTMEYEPFCYWEDFEDVTLLSNNPLFPVNKQMRSNVSSGYGYWAGYGSVQYKVSVSDSLNVK